MWKHLLGIGASLTMLSAATADEGWRLYGGTQTDQRFSSLNQINEQTVSRLGLVWSTELGTTRGLEATPIVEDGVIYTTGAWSVVFALDAKTGQMKWTYDPKVPRERAYFICCDVVNRGGRSPQRQNLCGHARRAPHRPRSTYGRLGVERSNHGPDQGVFDHCCATHRDEIRSSSATQARNTVYAAISRPTTRKPANKPGASTRSLAIRRAATNPRPWKPRPRLGRGRTGGERAAGAQHGKAWSMIPSSTCFSSDRQRLHLVPLAPRRGRQSLHGLHPGSQSEHRRTRLVFPDHARRQLRLRRHSTAHAGRSGYRRPAA